MQHLERKGTHNSGCRAGESRDGEGLPGGCTGSVWEGEALERDGSNGCTTM